MTYTEHIYSRHMSTTYPHDMLSPLTPIGITRKFRGGGVTPDTTSTFLRGDWVETRITDLHNGVTTSRLVRIICGVRVTNFKKVTGYALSDEMYQTEKNKEEDTVYFLLVRYARPHALCRRNRGPDHRPLCPGLLRDTHCLWEWATRDRGFRRGCLQGRNWDVNKHFFGYGRDSILNSFIFNLKSFSSNTYTGFTTRNRSVIVWGKLRMEVNSKYRLMSFTLNHCAHC